MTEPTLATSAAASGRKKHLRTWLGKLFLVALTALICLLLFEWLVRLFLPTFHPARQVVFLRGIRRNAEGIMLGTPSTQVNQRTPKGDYDVTIRFNRHGFRDSKDHMQSTAKDIFVAGDSFSFGWGVQEEERFSNLLENKLKSPVFNLAIIEDIRGYGNTVSYAEKHGAQVRNLIVGVCMENDLLDYTKPIQTWDSPGDYEPVLTFRHRLALWFRTHSALWICVSYTVQRHAAFRHFFEMVGIARNVEDFTHNNEATPGVLTSSRDELLRYLTNYNSVVLIIPSRGLWAGKNMAVEQEVHKEFVELLHQAHLKVVDMKPIFEKAGDPLRFYFQTDPHWNSRGHTAAADALYQFLSSDQDWKNLLPPVILPRMAQ